MNEEDWITQLTHLVELKGQGLITDDEFKSLRAKLIRNQSGDSESASGTLELGSRLGEYELLERLGEGGMGVVYRARHRVLEIAQAQGDRALKVLKRDGASAEAETRFKHEAVKGMRIKSAQVAEVFELIEWGGRLALVMEYIDGPSLSTYEGEPIRELVEALKPLGALLDELHASGVIHRDLKPENVKLHPDRGPVLLDFGIAKEHEIELTLTTRAMGTPLYMSPEQLDARSVTGASDQYSLALMLYRLATRSFPWGDESSMARVIVYKTGDESPTWHEGMGLSELELDALSRGMSRHPEKRFKTCQGLLQAVLREGKATVLSAPRPMLQTQALPAISPASGLSETMDQAGMSYAKMDQAKPVVKVVEPAVKVLEPVVEAEALRGWSFGRWLAVVGLICGLGWIGFWGMGVVAESAPCSQSSVGCPSISWVRIPGGSFMMGSNDGDSNEQPIHRVEVPSFMMTKSEVTVGQYRKCVEAGVCSEPDAAHSHCNWDKSGREDHPINCVDWGQARTFSRWVGGDLPTEAEWEYAARGAGQSIKYPWGNASPSCDYAVMYDGGDGCGRNSTWPVCSKKRGNTRQGLCDMGGSVWEWTLDEYKDSYSQAPSKGNLNAGQVPTCSTSCSNGSSRRVGRGGGGWPSVASGLRASVRGGSDPSLRFYNLGFRSRRTDP